jgi:hypothetical protein
MRAAAVMLVALALGLAGCVSDSGPDPVACDAESIELELRLTADALTPENPSVCRDQEVTLRIASEVDGFIHIHGYDEIVPATEVTDGETLELTFQAERDGQFHIELHPAAAPEGVEVGIFTVNEP